MKAVLFRNLLEDGSFSMQRYASELSAALRSECGDHWQLQDFVSHRPQIVGKLIPGKHGIRLDSALGPT